MNEVKFYDPLRRTDFKKEMAELQWNVLQAATLFHNKCFYRANRKVIMKSLERANKNLNAISEFVNFFRGYMATMNTEKLDEIEDKQDKEWIENLKDIQIPKGIKNISEFIDLDDLSTNFLNNTEGGNK